MQPQAQPNIIRRPQIMEREMRRALCRVALGEICSILWQKPNLNLNLTRPGKSRFHTLRTVFKERLL
jgi:hypothetical protein